MKTNLNKSPIFDVVEEGLNDINSVKSIPKTIREFNKLKYQTAKEYSPAEIVRLRRKRLKLSQSSFAFALNAKLSTVQKWERGVRKPATYAHRLFQLFEKKGIALIEK
jgi:putative transcriptional regulator